ncbi:MAG: hypothetical protein D6806_18260, partial [Deltaproteobacteria bacterium]
MDRRDFIRAIAAAGAGGLAACRTVPVRPDGSPEPVPLDAYLAQGARVMWCAAHPDDECFPGGILARASIFYRNPLHLVVMTHGEGGECGLARGCNPDLATVRGQEMQKAAEIYRASLDHEHFFNAPLPVESFPPRHEIWRRWKAYKDPVLFVARAIRRFRPDLLITFHPDWGATGHPEHQLASRCATTAVRMAADPKVDIDGLGPHRVGRTYYILNRVCLFVLLGRADPGPVTETFDATLPATASLSCVD